MVLSLHLGPNSSILEDSQVAYWLEKGIVFPSDKEKFAKMRDEIDDLKIEYLN